MLKKRWKTSDLVKVRWHGVKREERVCKVGDSRELEDLCIGCCSALHWIISDSCFWKQEKTIQERAMESVGSTTFVCNYFYVFS